MIFKVKVFKSITGSFGKGKDRNALEGVLSEEVIVPGMTVPVGSTVRITNASEKVAEMDNNIATLFADLIVNADEHVAAGVGDAIALEIRSWTEIVNDL